MPGHEDFTSLEALPPCVGDAPVAALLLRDVAASVAGRHGAVRASSVEVADAGSFVLRPTSVTGTAIDTEHAPLAAPELFDGAEADGRSDVYAAACLALTRYLGSSPVPAPALARRAPTKVRIGAVRQAHRTLPARLGALPDPFRGVFAQAVAKQPHLRPTPAALVTQLDAAFAAAGTDVEATARARVARLVLLARVFMPVETAGAAAVLAAPPVVLEKRAAAAAPLHLPLRSLPAFVRPSGVARVALIAAVAVLATGGVAVAAVVGLGGGTPKTPQAVSSRQAPTPSASPSISPVAETSAVASSSVAPPATSIAAPTTAPARTAAPPANNSGGGSNNGSNNDGSNNGSNSGGSSGGNSNGGGSSPPSSNPPAPPRTSTPKPPPATTTKPTPPPPSTPTPPRGSPTGPVTGSPTTGETSPAIATSSDAAPTSADGA